MSSLEPTHCLNCGAALAQEHDYCGRCGQKARPLRLNLRDIAADLVHALLHVDHSVLSLVRLLAVRPGAVAREYVEGRRKSYFGPFAFLVIVVGSTSALVALSGFTAVHASQPVEAAPIVDFLQRHLNLAYFTQVPLLAAACAVLFRGDRRFYAEHLVLASYTTGMRSLLLMIVAVPLWWVLRPPEIPLPLTYAYLGLWIAYFGFAASQFYRGRRWVGWLKGAAAAVLAQVAITLLLGGAIAGYSLLSGSG